MTNNSFPLGSISSTINNNFLFNDEFNDEINFENNLLNFVFIDSDSSSNINYYEEENKYLYDNNNIKHNLRKTIGWQKLFEVIDPQKIYLFTFSKKEDYSIKYCNREECFQPLKKERSSTRKKRFYSRDNIRVKIKRAFFNILIKKINELIIQMKGNEKLLLKFDCKFSSNVKKSTNKKILNMTLNEIFENKGLYGDTTLTNYYYNLKIVNDLKQKNDTKFNKILNMQFRDLFEEYINSDEFKIEEINRLKRKKMKEDYIKRYIITAYNFIEFFSS